MGFPKALFYLQRESLSCYTKLIYFLQKTTSCIGLQAEQIFSVNIKYTYFFNFVHGFWGSFSMLFPTAPALYGKKISK